MSIRKGFQILVFSRCVLEVLMNLSAWHDRKVFQTPISVQFVLEVLTSVSAWHDGLVRSKKILTIKIC